MKLYQKGATLIVVMFALILMTLIGTLALKQSLVGLNIATNSQTQTLMQQTADAVFFALERDNQNDDIFQKNLSALGLFGLIKSNSFLDKELVFCYRPKSQTEVFQIETASVIYAVDEDEVDNTEIGIDGFCTYSDGDFSSGRDFMISQISVKKGSLNSDVPFKYYPLGTDMSTVQLDQVQPVQITVTTVIPGAATGIGAGWSSFSTQINNCFKNHLNEKSTQFPELETVAECFNNLGVPYSQQVMEYAVISYATED
jgi:hypothetical protein